MRETALGLAARGFHVFPITAGAKAPPLIPSWQTKATSDPAIVEAWWAYWPDANVGIHCDGLVVIDVDPKNGGRESLAALEQEITLEATYEVETPSGGTHIYYRLPAGAAVRNGVSVLGAGIDIRTTSGYVVASGSRTAAGEYRVVADEDIAEVDPAILSRLTAVPPKPERPADADPIVTNPDAAIARAHSFLEAHPVAVQGQGGDHHTFKTICRIRDFGVPQARALEALADWNSRCVPPWDQGELETKIANAYKYAQEPAGSWTPEAAGFDVIPQEEVPTPKPSESGGEPTEPADDLLHPADVRHEDVLQNKYIIKRVLDQQSNAMLFGTWNVGKTFVVLDMAASVACGLPWFGCKVKQGRVLYVGYEGIIAMRKRMIALREKYPALKNKATPFRWAAMTAPITDDAGWMQLKKIIARFKTLHGGAPDLVIIDPLADALGGDDSNPDLIAVLKRRLASMRRVEKCASLAVHHTGHSNEERARGHSSLPAGIDTNIRVDRDHISMMKQRDDVKKQFDFDLKEVTVGIDQDGESVTTMIVEQLDDNPTSGKLTRTLRELMDALVMRHGDGATVTATDVSDCCPESMAADQKRKCRDDLVRKQYLIPEDKKFRIVAAGPAPQFEEVK
jgi:hypothetical protein